MTNTDAKPRALLLCGGASAEHDVSLNSARSLLQETSDAVAWTTRVIARDGHWFDAPASSDILQGQRDSDHGSVAIDVPALVAAEVVFPLLHGPYGEDGRLQGTLELLGVRYVGAGVLASAVGMDKLMMKAVFAAHGLPQVDYHAVTRHAFQRDPNAVESALAPLAWPRFVKPANLGSSIGITRVFDEAAQRQAIEAALAFDRRVIVEQSAGRIRELEVAVLGYEDARASVVGEIDNGGHVYDYESKYTPGVASLLVPAALDEAVAERCRSMALAAFRAIDGAGLARVDFFYRPDDHALFLNEINTMPGFTATSMFPRLWAASGIPYPRLAQELVRMAHMPRR